MKNILELTNKNIKVFCKIICKPEEEYENIDLFELLIKKKVPVAFVPLEYNYYFRDNFLKDLVSYFLTSNMYNARFFRIDNSATRLCKAGTIDGFKINLDGNIVRCSTNQQIVGNLDSLIHSLQKTEVCNVKYECYCEWHHWNDWTLANDNETWTKFIKTGCWEKPSKDEFYSFIEKMNWSSSGRKIE